MRRLRPLQDMFDFRVEFVARLTERIYRLLEGPAGAVRLRRNLPTARFQRFFNRAQRGERGVGRSVQFDRTARNAAFEIRDGFRRLVRYDMQPRRLRLQRAANLLRLHQRVLDAGAEQAGLFRQLFIDAARMAGDLAGERRHFMRLPAQVGADRFRRVPAPCRWRR